MTIKYQRTHEEEALADVLTKSREVLSEAAHTILSEAGLAAYAVNMVHNYCYQPEEYDEAMEKMRLAALEGPQVVEKSL